MKTKFTFCLPFLVNKTAITLSMTARQMTKTAWMRSSVAANDAILIRTALVYHFTVPLITPFSYHFLWKTSTLQGLMRLPFRNLPIKNLPYCKKAVCSLYAKNNSFKQFLWQSLEQRLAMTNFPFEPWEAILRKYDSSVCLAEVTPKMWEAQNIFHFIELLFCDSHVMTSRLELYHKYKKKAVRN